MKRAIAFTAIAYACAAVCCFAALLCIAPTSPAHAVPWITAGALVSTWTVVCLGWAMRNEL